MKVIINADDFGLSKGVNLGILEAFTNGIVTSTTMIVNMDGFSHGLKMIKENTILSVGIHLMLTQGRPLTQGLTTIVDKNGMFLNQTILREKVSNNMINLTEVEGEYTAQIEKLIRCGVYPTHIDSHHHIHELPGFFEISLKLAKKYNIPVRLFHRGNLPEECRDTKTVGRFYPDFYGDNILVETIQKIIEDSTDQVVEIMSHPAYIDEVLRRKSSYVGQREKELEILKDPKLKGYLVSKGVQLINYTQI